jgi:hypothetical protein
VVATASQLASTTFSRARAADPSDVTSRIPLSQTDTRSSTYNRRPLHAPGRPFTLEIASHCQARGHTHVQGGDGALSWSQPNRASKAEVILELGNQQAQQELAVVSVLTIVAEIPIVFAHIHHNRGQTSAESPFTSPRPRPPHSCSHPSRAVFMSSRFPPTTHHAHCSRPRNSLCSISIATPVTRDSP